MQLIADLRRRHIRGSPGRMLGLVDEFRDTDRIDLRPDGGTVVTTTLISWFTDADQDLLMVR